MTPEPPDPLILTVMLDLASQAHFDRLRERHFPPSINYLRAHVTLFHHLPGEQRDAIEARLAKACQGIGRVPFSVTGVRFLGRGNAYSLAMPDIVALRRQLAQDWLGWLTRQDQQPWQPHVTVQNKVPAADAKRLHADLQAGFVPFTGSILGFCLWAYRGGPWQHLASYRFQPLIVEERG